MTNPFDHPFLQRDSTMYLSTICNSPLTKPSRISPLDLLSTAKVHSSRKISRELLLKSIFLCNQKPPLSNCPPMSSPFQTEINTSAKLPILSLSMISKEPGPSAMNLEAKDWLTPFVPCICSLQLPKL